MVLHQRNMLVSRRMEDKVRLNQLEVGFRRLRLDDIVKERTASEFGREARDLAIDLKEGVLRSINQNELGRIEGRGNARQFATDRAARPGDEDALVLDERADGLLITLPRRTINQRRQVELRNCARTDAGKLILERGHEPIGNAQPAQPRTDRGDKLVHDGRQRDEGKTRPSLSHDCLELIDGAERRRVIVEPIGLGIVVGQDPTQRYGPIAQQVQLSFKTAAVLTLADDDGGLGHAAPPCDASSDFDRQVISAIRRSVGPVLVGVSSNVGDHSGDGEAGDDQAQ